MAHESPEHLRRIAKENAPSWALRADFDTPSPDPGTDVVFAYRRVSENAMVEQKAEVGPGGVLFTGVPTFYVRHPDGLDLEQARAVASDLAVLADLVAAEREL